LVVNSNGVFVTGNTDYAHILTAPSTINKAFILKFNKADLSFGYFSMIQGYYDEVGGFDALEYLGGIIGTDN
jgi:hypothetical protein